MAIITMIMIFLPLLVHITGIGVLENELEKSYLLSAANSKEWQYALVGSVAVSIPFAIDFLLDIMSSNIFNSSQHIESLLPKFSLIFSLMVPNLVLVVAIPLQYVELNECLFTSCGAPLFYGMMGNMWILGGNTFKSIWFLFAEGLLLIGVVMIAWDAISTNQVSQLFWTGLALFFVSGLIFIVFINIWFLSLRRIPFRQLSVEQLSCSIYAILFSVIGVFIFITLIVMRGHYDIVFNCVYTYMEAAVTIVMITLQGHVARHEVRMKEVS